MSFDVALLVVGLAILVPGLYSTTLKRMALSVPFVALALGVLLGPEMLAVLEPGRGTDEHAVLKELARITLAFSLVATGLQMRPGDLRTNGARAALLLTVAMAGMWLVTSAGAHLLLGLPIGFALLLGAILTPTDPVVASTIVTGRLAEQNVPRWVRRTLQLESGANDGLALVFVLVPALVLAEAATGPGAAIAEAAGKVALAVAIGAAIGVVAGLLVDRASESEQAGESFLFAMTIGLSLATLGAVHALGGSGILASFVAGVSFSLAIGEERADELERIQTGIERSLVVAVFLFFGAILPWSAWGELGWAAAAFVAWVLLLRRPPVVPLALAPSRTARRPVAFLAWFGPLGVAALYYSLEVERFGFARYEELFAAATLAIAVSVVVHTLTAMPGVRRYAGRRVTVPLRHPLSPESDAAP